MATLRVIGPFRGPGEEKTAETLAEHLPDNWALFANTSLPGNRDDLDLIVVTPTSVFVVEEKAWGPTVEAGPRKWSTSRREYLTPLDRVAHLSRVLASTLSNKVAGFKDAVGREHRVKEAVVLSHDNLKLSFTKDFDHRELVLPLRDGIAAERFVLWSEGLNEIFDAGIMDRITKFFTGLEPRSSPERIGDYEVIQELTPLGYARCFLAKSTDQMLVLRCYEEHGWGLGDDVNGLVLRESRAFRALEDTARTERAFPVFIDEVHGWVVTPISKGGEERSLSYSVKKQDPERPGGRLPQQMVDAIVADAFVGLSEVHEAGLVHRALHPTRVLIGKRLTVKFSDFMMAQMQSQESIAPWLNGFDEDPSVQFRAPECATDPRFSTTKSDVFSLALSMAGWVVGDFGLSRADLLIALSAYGLIGSSLEKCLAEDPAERPQASEVVAELQLGAAALVEPSSSALMEAADLSNIGHSSAEAWESGGVISERYAIERRLGRGGFATTWKALDLETGSFRVLKQFHSGVDVELLEREFRISERLAHDRCARTWDFKRTPSPGYLVHEYVEGQNLEEYSRAAGLTAADIQRIAIDVLDGLAYLHGVEVLHRDLTPRNIVVDLDGRAKLIDFGLSSSVDGLSLPGAGTPEYFAPEQLLGGPATKRSDLFSFAVTFLRVMLGRAPYLSPLDRVGASRVLAPATEAERLQWGPLGASLLSCFERGASIDPSERPLSADDFKTDLKMALKTALFDGDRLENAVVTDLRYAYRGSILGNSGNRGLDDEFSRSTYVRTLLDDQLVQRVISRELKLVLLTGNPGDGKTAFLVKILEQLVSAGGSIEQQDQAGWGARLDGHTFCAVFDASESHEGTSSDDLIRRAIDPQPGQGADQHTALIAINDGRLRQFFTDYEHLYEGYSRAVRRHASNQSSEDAGVAVVDLKQRSLANRRLEPGLAMRVLDSFIRPDRWEVCKSCLSREVCPILRNVNEMRGPAGEGIAELVMVSHLRRRRRATFRDVRSALGWMITGDRSCEEVHLGREAGSDLRLGNDAIFEDLAFSKRSSDYLIAEWAEIDPANVPAPEIARASREADGSGGFGFVGAQHRRVFFESETDGEHGRETVRAYRHFEEIIEMLEEPSAQAKQRLLLGLSRMVGASGFSDPGLAIAAGDPTKDWAVLKTLDEAQFELIVPFSDAAFVEAVPDRLVLSHAAGAVIELTLDTAEIILRAADGELLDDSYSDAIKQEIEGFTSQLRRQPSVAVLVVDGLGNPVEVSRVGTTIMLEAR